MSVDVSVLTPVLNEEEHIREAAAKMLSQRFDGEIEFIFIDGASEDRTVAILRELARSDPRVHILDNPRRSTPSSLNIGLAEARGAFIARMDAHTFYAETTWPEGSRACSAAARPTSAARSSRVERAPGRAGWRWHSTHPWAAAAPSSVRPTAGRSR